MTHLAGFINPKGHGVRNGNSVGVGGRREGVGKSDTVNVSEILAHCHPIWMQLQKSRHDLMSRLGHVLASTIARCS